MLATKMSYQNTISINCFLIIQLKNLNKIKDFFWQILKKCTNAHI